MGKIKFLFLISFIFLAATNVKAATNVTMANSQYAYSPVVYDNFNYYYGSYIANLAINTAQTTTSSNAYAARSRTYAYFSSANALRTNRQYQAKMRVCGGSSLWADQVETAVPTKLHWAYNTSQSMTGAIDGNIDDLIMTYTTESSANGGCVNFTFTFTPPVDNLRAVGFWVTYSRLSPVSTCWVADCSNETHVNATLADTSTSPGVGNGGSFNIRTFSISYTESGTSTATIEMNQQIMIQQQQQTNQNITNINDNLNDDDTEDEASDFASFLNSFSTDTHGLTGIVTAPLTAIQSLTSATCEPLVLPLPFINTNLTLPCMRPIYDSTLGSFMQIYDVITFGIVAYWVCVRIFGMVKDFKNPEHDEIEVMDL